MLGTKEWAEKTVNLFQGNCPNGCIYCYASAMNYRFKKDTKYEVRLSQWIAKPKAYKGLVMYPSTHDIHDKDINYHITFIEKLLEAGNNILIVSKPEYRSIINLCHHFDNYKYKSQIEFRFSIGSSFNGVLNFYEPNAPSYEDRCLSVVHANLAGFKTSLSIEPMLDMYPNFIIDKLDSFVHEIWIGKINKPISRVSLNGHSEKIPVVKALADWQAIDLNIMAIVDRLSGNKKIKWKDSINEVIKRNVKL